MANGNVQIPEVLTDPQRHGVLTTEFWITLLGMILAVCLRVHLVTQDDANFISAQITAAVPLVVQLVVIGGLVYHYVRSRTAVKMTPQQWPPMHYVTLPADLAAQVKDHLSQSGQAPPAGDQTFKSN